MGFRGEREFCGEGEVRVESGYGGGVDGVFFRSWGSDIFIVVFAGSEV